MSKLQRNIITGVLAQITIIGLSFIATRYIYRQLGNDVLGLLYFSFTMVTVVNQATVAGIGNLIVREVAANASNEPKYVHRLFATLHLIYLLLFGAVGVMMWFAIPWFTEHWLTLQSIRQVEAIQFVRILLLGIFVGLLGSLYNSVLRGFEDIGYINLVDTFAAALRQFGILFLLWLGAGSYALAWWIGGLGIVVSILYWLRVRRSLPQAAARPFGWHGDVIRKNRSFGLNMMGISFLTSIQMQTDKLVISGLLPVASLGYFSFTQNVVTRSQVIRSAVTAAAAPRQSSLAGAQDHVSLAQLHRKLIDLQMLGLAPIYAAVGVALWPLLSFTFTPEIASQLMIPGITLVVSTYLAGIASQTGQLSISLGRADIMRRANQITVLAVVPLSIFFISQFGLLGAGIAHLIRSILNGFLILPVTHRECLGVKPSAWQPHHIQGILLAVMTYGTMGVVLTLVSNMNPLVLLTGYLIATSFYIPFALRIMEPSLVSQLGKNIQSLRRAVFRPALPTR